MSVTFLLQEGALRVRGSISLLQQLLGGGRFAVPAQSLRTSTQWAEVWELRELPEEPQKLMGLLTDLQFPHL